MKQVIIYNQIGTDNHGGGRYIDDELKKFFHCQIDISLHLGYLPQDIILGTNFNFEYREVKSHILTDICEWSGFHNFWYGAIELMERGVLDEDFWLHDHDSWPNRYFNFPDFQGEIAGCEYQGTTEWNCASIYCKSSSLETLKAASNDIKDKLSYLKGVSDIRDNLPLGKREISFTLTEKGKNLGFDSMYLARKIKSTFDYV